MPLIDYFPTELGKPRHQQIDAVNFIESAFSRDINIVCLEMPVGSGKSAVGVTLSRAFGKGVIAAPRVQLQQQYINDFDNIAPLVGRGRFPCLKKDYNASTSSFKAIREGYLPTRPVLENSCAAAPCLNRPRAKQQMIKEECDAAGGCPHQIHIDVAQEEETIVANLHSLVFAMSLNERIPRRKVLVIDEAHNLFNFVQDFSKVQFYVRRKVNHSEVAHLKTTEQWKQWLELPEQTMLLPDEDARDSYKSRLEKLDKLGESVQGYDNDPKTGYFRLTLTPVYVGGLAQSLLFSIADKIVLMSGTILNKDLFCRPLGLDPDKVAYKRIDSDFPADNRKIFMPRVQSIDLSFKTYDQNIKLAATEINHIAAKYPGKKGIIITNSYKMTRSLSEILHNHRTMTHESEDFATKLAEFKTSKEPLIFCSPVIQEGYDFADDLCRFNIIVAPAYESAGSPYIKWLLAKNGWNLYNYAAVKVLLQSLGRGVRHKNDKCDNYLIDGRFTSFLHKNRGLIPQWVQDSYK